MSSFGGGLDGAAAVAYWAEWWHSRRGGLVEQCSRGHSQNVDSAWNHSASRLRMGTEWVFVYVFDEQSEPRIASPFLHTASRGLFCHIWSSHLHSGCKQWPGRRRVKTALSLWFRDTQSDVVGRGLWSFPCQQFVHMLE
jgi:hypothetical protein